MPPTSFRTKLMLSIFSIAVLLTALFAFFSIRQSQRLVFENNRTAALTVAVGAAAQVDGDLHENLKTPADQESAAYGALEKQLRNIRDINRRDDIHIKFIYTMRRVSENPDAWIYVVDAEEKGGDKSNLGEDVVWENQELTPIAWGEARADEVYIEDEFGRFLTAEAPIRNSAGEVVGTLGVDIEESNVIAQTNEIIMTSLISLSIAFVIAAILSYLLVKKICAPLEQISSGIRQIGRGHLEHRLPNDRSDEFGEIHRAVNEMAQSLQERDALKGTLSRFVSQEVAGKLIGDNTLPKLEGERREITLLHCDIKNLHSLAENCSPAKILEIVNDYCREMVEVIFQHRGTIERLTGDGLIAAFGALGRSGSHQSEAVKSAAELLATNERMNEKWELVGTEAFQLKIAIHTGMATFGNVGSDHRVDFAVVGEAIDFVKAIEALNEEYSTHVLISEQTHAAVSSEFKFTEVGDFRPAPLRDMIRLFTLRKASLKPL